MKRAAAALLIAAVLLAAPVFANHTSQTDRNDTPGLLDVRSVDFNHGASRPRWRFTTFGGWTVGQIWDAGYLMVELDTKGDEQIDHVALLRSDGRELVATLYRLRADGRQVVMGGLDAGRAGSQGAWLAIALHKLAFGASRTSYFWSAVTSFTGPPCPRTCLDRVPDEGMVEQPLPGVTPSPSPSPSPTPSPSPSPTPSPTPSPSPSR